MGREADMVVSNMRRTVELGTDFWNDSCDLQELGEAVQEGAVGATSNPVIVYQVVQKSRDTWIPVLDTLIREHRGATEDEVAWRLIAEVARRAAAVLQPVYEKTEKRKGFLSVQVNPKFFSHTDRMVAHARELAAIAPNIAVKIPATEAGMAAIERLTAEGIRVNATVCFSVSQVLACAEAVERGVGHAKADGRDTTTLLPTVTIMVGRVDDHLRRVMEAEEITVDPGHINLAGIAVFKKAYQIFRTKPYRSTLLSAAYRYHMQWTELIGERVIQTMPYKWWKQFNASVFAPALSITNPVAPETLNALYESFPDFRKAYDEEGMQPSEFVS
ncbi:MAG: transaldolase family protein, partial [Candidatus Krumholzibacteriia bacterium]